MNPVVQLLSDLSGRGISLTLDGERFLCKAPKNAITPELKQKLTDQKAAIIAFLKSCQTTPSNSPTPVSPDATLPLSRAQQRLWFISQLSPQSPAYNTALPFRLRGPFHRHHAERALKEILARHVGLQYSFASEAGAPVAHLSSIDGWSLETVPAGRAEAALILAAAEARRPFDLTNGPLFRATLFEIAADDHLLLITVHHIVSDGWSLSILAKEFLTLYEAFEARKSSPLPPLATQYPDYVRWEQARERADLDAPLAYWKGKLAGLPPVLELPSYETRTSTKLYQGQRFRGVIPSTLIEPLQQLCAERQVTLFMALMAAFKVLLFRYTGIDDVLIGSASAGRDRAEIAGLIGLFVNVMPLRTSLAGNPRFVDLLVRAKETAVGAYAHAEVPFDLLLQKLNLPRDSSDQPLFTIAFSLQNFRMETLSSPALEMTLEEIELGISRYDLNLEIYPGEEGYRCGYEFDTKVFAEPFIERLHGHFVTLLEGIVANPSERIAALPLLTAGELQTMLYDWNQTADPVPPFRSVHARFEAQVAERPNAPAIRHGDRTLTYAELNRAADRFAAHLRHLDVEPHTPIAVCLERTPELSVAVFGILKAGAAYLPIDPALPLERISFMARHAGCAWAVIQRSLANAWSDVPIKTILIDGDWESGTAANADISPPATDPEDLAVVIYTSGSTATPKGIEIPHRAVLNIVHAARLAPGLGPGDRYLSGSSLSFDIATMELLAPMLTGACSCLIDRRTQADPQKLIEAIAFYDATLMTGTPASLRPLVELGWAGKADFKAVTGGEPMPMHIGRELAKRCHSLWNAYSPSETTIWSLIERLNPADPHVVVGHPISNTRIYLLDFNRRPVPIGVPGEIFIAGDGVALGYRNWPELTAQKFRPDPFHSSGNMYQTGDLGRYHEDGRLELLGRIDRQLKLRGYRIEPGEIEAVLERHPGVQQAYLAMRSVEAGSRLVAYIRGRKEDASPADLRLWTGRSLPRYMVPAAFVYLDSFPLSPNGKIDDAALAQMLPANLTVPGSSAGLTPVQQTIVSVWKDLLQVEAIGLTDHVFDHGAHSLLLVKAHERLSTELGVPLTISDLFEHPSVESLAQHVEHGRAALGLQTSAPVLAASI